MISKEYVDFLTKTKKSPNTSFTIDGKALQAALARTIALATSRKSEEDKAEYVLLIDKGCVYLVGSGSESLSITKIDSETTARGCFQFDCNMLNGLIKGRGDLEMSLANGTLSIKQVKGKYSATLKTQEVSLLMANSVKVRTQNDSKGVKLSRSDVDMLRTALAKTNLASLYDKSPIYSTIAFKDGKLRVAAFDNYHMAYFQGRVEFEKSLKFAFSQAMFNLIYKYFEKDDSVRFIIDSAFAVRGDTFMVSMPQVQLDSSTFETVSNFIKSMTKPHAKFKFKEAGIKTVTNLFSLAVGESRLVLDVTPKGINLSMSTDAGSASDAFKTEVEGKPVRVLIDPKVFSDLFDKCTSKEVETELYTLGKSGGSSAFMIRDGGEGYRTHYVGTYYNA